MLVCKVCFSEDMIFFASIAVWSGGWLCAFFTDTILVSPGLVVTAPVQWQFLLLVQY